MLDKLLDAGETLLLERGFDGVTVGDVVSRAGCSVGAFYARFPGREALLDALHQRFVDRFYDVADALADPAIWGGVPIAEQLRTWVDSLVQVTVAQRRLLRAFTVAGTVDPQMRSRYAAFCDYSIRCMFETVKPRLAEIDHPDPELALSLTYNMVMGTLNWLLVFDGDELTPFPLRAEVLTPELTRMALAYLGLATGTPDE